MDRDHSEVFISELAASFDSFKDRPSGSVALEYQTWVFADVLQKSIPVRLRYSSSGSSQTFDRGRNDFTDSLVLDCGRQI